MNRRVLRKRDDGDELREVSTESGKGGSEMRLLRGNASMMEDGEGRVRFETRSGKKCKWRGDELFVDG